MSTRQCLGLVLGLELLAIAGLAVAQQAKAPSCEITITSPRPGTTVGASGTVKGAARTPASSHLWVLAHKKTLNGWWPQGGGETPVTDGQWGEIEVTYGEERDRGDFEVAVVAVGEDTHKELNKWVDTAPERHYPPIRFPATIEACPVARITVVKQ
jgi:hypothetical protein